MMPAQNFPSSLIKRMPEVRGRLHANEPMARYTWFKVGGPAEVFFRPADEQDLAAFLSNLPADVAVSVIGNASNIIVRDGGIAGVVIRLGSGFSQISVDQNNLVVGAGAADQSVSRTACDAGIGGLEFLSGIPGSLGGSVRMNAGAYGREIADICLSARFVDRHGQVHERKGNELGFAYRRTSIDPDWIVTQAVLSGQPGEKPLIAERMAEIQVERCKTQPVKTLTGGSTFANPPGMKAWQLIDDAGCRGLRRGGAMVSELHCNFLMNTQGATASDLEGLGEEVRRRVFERSGVLLEWEVRRIGAPPASEMKEITP